MYTFTNFVQYLPFFVQMCIILTTFVYSQFKLALQVQSKHIKILKTKNKKQKQSSNQLAYLKGKEKEKRKEKVHLTN